MQQKINTDISLVNRISAKHVRDLIWLVYSPNIASSFLSPEIEFRFKEELLLQDLLTYFQHESVELETHPARLPLGKYAEQLIARYFTLHPHYSLLANSIQLIENKITLGELDYLIYDHVKDQHIHLEFAIKYYLKTVRDGEPIFLGPSTKDWLGRKLKNMTQSQAKLSLTNAHLLPESLQQHSFSSKVAIKGSLFIPYAEWRLALKSPLNQGWWLSILDIKQLYTDASQFYLISDRMDWIFPFYKQYAFYDENELESHICNLLSDRNEVMLVRLSSSNKPIDRGFIVRENWPY